MLFDPRICETFTSPTNIAVIKYWGKNDVKLNTPMNSSASLTLDQDDLHTITSIAADRSFTADRLWLNGVEIEINNRGKTCISEIRKIAQDRIDPTTGEVLVKKEDWVHYGLHISSVNTFPTGAGLASSAAGLACLVAALAKLFNAKEDYPGQLTAIARQGSGSASRSMFGGFVRWQKGERADATDSIAVQIADENYWPEIRAVILVVSDKEKDTSSTSGMETSRLTSLLLQHRASHIVQARLDEMENAYLQRDFETFGRITMQDSNQFHAVCLDTYPPIFYMNDVSKMIIRIVHVINSFYNQVKAAYTFDAGPNAVIYTLDEFTPILSSIMAKYFPAPHNNYDNYCNKPSELQHHLSQFDSLIPPELIKRINETGRIPIPNDVKYIFLTKSGPGPINQPLTESLLDYNTGLPKEPGPKHKKMKIESIA
eukprot:gene7312-9962_t